jgi:hypothetical protein
MRMQEPIDEAHKLIKALWKTAESKVPNWHGWGFRDTGDGPKLLLYILPGSDDRLLLELTSHISRLLPIEIVELNQFRQSSVHHKPSPHHKRPPHHKAPMAITLRPGEGVRATSSNAKCKESCPGTIGAFLREVGTTKPIWLLSNHHVLAIDNDCPPVKVFSQDDHLISSEIRFIHLDDDGNRVDAAVAKLMDFVTAQPLYDPIEITATDPATVADDSIVRKLGHKTAATCGKVRHAKCTMRILDCAQNNNREFVDQIMIESVPGKPVFLAKGDSGSLVVADKKPAGLLFAITDSGGAGLAVGLAAPWETLMNEISGIFPSPIEMILMPAIKVQDPCVA